MGTTVFSREQSRRVDEIAIHDYGIPGVVLMENAGRGVVDVMERIGIDRPVVICCGRGNNAGDGFVIARHLEIRGYQAQVILASDPGDLTGDAAVNYRILEKTDVPVRRFDPKRDEEFEEMLDEAGWVVDALLGTGARGEPRPPMDRMLELIDRHAPRGRLAVDVPTGLDCDTGQPASVTFSATTTCTLAAMKPGLLRPEAREYVGESHVVDIGIPPKLLREVAAS